MENILLCLPQWEALRDSERLAAAHDLVKQMPKGFVFRSLETCSLESQSHPVAFFDWDSGDGFPGKFALIPGGDVTLGYDRASPFVPTTAQVESWQETQDEYGTPDLTVFLDEYMTPFRTIHLGPVLMETALLDDESPDEILAANRALGFRLPTSNEWEWACGAGARTLWRWGNDCPADAYPSDCRGRGAKWELQRQTNAFGLRIGDDDYNQELCEDNVVRGGDGGCFTCGGAGFLAAWLTLASAYATPEQEVQGSTPEYWRGRRVFPL